MVVAGGNGRQLSKRCMASVVRQVALIHRPFAERLIELTSNRSTTRMRTKLYTPSQMPFWALEESWDYTPPKSVQLIRRMLRRIRHWVRWGVS